MTYLKKSIKPYDRNKRITYLIGIVLTILLGLASRRYSPLLPSFATQNAGDILWVMMVYFGFRFLIVHKSLFRSLLLSFLFSFSIESSQLYQGDWINQIRGTLLGAVILGKGFLTVDLLRYTAGILFAYVFDKLILKFFCSNKKHVKKLASFFAIQLI